MIASSFTDFHSFYNIVMEVRYDIVQNFEKENFFLSNLFPFIQRIRVYNEDKSDSFLLSEKYFFNSFWQIKFKGSKFIFKKLNKYSDNYFSHSDEIDSYIDRISDELLEEIPLDLDSNATYLLLFELINNVYKHSNFVNAYVLCQIYLESNMLDICIIDDGVTIPNSLKSNNIYFKNDSESIFKAINGATADKEKENRHGRGLNTSANIVVYGFGEELKIVSGKGIVIVTNDGIKCRDSDNALLGGTLICLKINTNKINDIYKYIPKIKFNVCN